MQAKAVGGAGGGSTNGEIDKSLSDPTARLEFEGNLPLPAVKSEVPEACYASKASLRPHTTQALQGRQCTPRYMFAEMALDRLGVC